MIFKKTSKLHKRSSSSIQYFQSISRSMQSQDLFEITIHLTFLIDFLVKRGRNWSFSVQKWLISIKNGLIFPRKWHLSARENQLILSWFRVLFVRDINLNKGVPVYFNSQLKSIRSLSTRFGRVEDIIYAHQIDIATIRNYFLFYRHFKRYKSTKPTLNNLKCAKNHKNLSRSKSYPIVFYCPTSFFVKMSIFQKSLFSTEKTAIFAQKPSYFTRYFSFKYHFRDIFLDYF